MAVSCARTGDADRRMRVLRLAAVSLIAAAAVGILPATPAIALTPIDLGTLGGNESYANAINRRGEVVGNAATSAGVRHAFFWTRKGGMVDLGTLGGKTSWAFAMNDEGQVVGSAETNISNCCGANTEHAFSWTPGGGMVDLGTLGGTSSRAEAINDRGEVAGNSSTNPSREGSDAFVWTAQAGFVKVGAGFPEEPSYSPQSYASAINDRGEVVGYEHQHVFFSAFAWTQAEGIKVLGSSENGFLGANAVNDSGQVVGTEPFSDGYHAVYWTPAGSAVDLGPGGAGAINARGQVVGHLTIRNAPEEIHHAALWDTGRLRHGH